MPDKIALKKLTASDLTFFEWQYRNSASKQKAINLNKDIFVDIFYPSAPSITPTTNDKILVDLTLFGPGMKGPHRLVRKIIKGKYKNWRLNGEFVYNPEDDFNRYNVLAPDDLALFIFKGDPVPNAASIVFISQHTVEDSSLFGRLNLLLRGKSMIALNRSDLEAAGTKVAISPGHPILPFLLDPEFEAVLEDAAYGDEKNTREIQRRKGRRVSSAELTKARLNANRIGRDGEELVALYLERQKTAAYIASTEWTADDNAVSPYDFRVTTITGQTIKIDAKSTEGDFGRDIHISAAEIAEAATSSERYDLYRVHSINEEGAKLKIAENIKTFAQQVREGLRALPEGVRPDSFSINPAILNWSDDIYIERQDE
jgi:hypothetical protein